MSSGDIFVADSKFTRIAWNIFGGSRITIEKSNFTCVSQDLMDANLSVDISIFEYIADNIEDSVIHLFSCEFLKIAQTLDNSVLIVNDTEFK